MDYATQFQAQIIEKSEAMLNQLFSVIDAITINILNDYAMLNLQPLYATRLPCSKTYTEQELLKHIDDRFALAKITGYEAKINIIPDTNCTNITITPKIV